MDSQIEWVEQFLPLKKNIQAWYTEQIPILWVGWAGSQWPIHWFPCPCWAISWGGIGYDNEHHPMVCSEETWHLGSLKSSKGFPWPQPLVIHHHEITLLPYCEGTWNWNQLHKVTSPICRDLDFWRFWKDNKPWVHAITGLLFVCEKTSSKTRRIDAADLGQSPFGFDHCDLHCHVRDLKKRGKCLGISLHVEGWWVRSSGHYQWQIGLKKAHKMRQKAGALWGAQRLAGSCMTRLYDSVWRGLLNVYFLTDCVFCDSCCVSYKCPLTGNKQFIASWGLSRLALGVYLGHAEVEQSLVVYTLSVAGFIFVAFWQRHSRRLHNQEAENQQGTRLNSRSGTNKNKRSTPLQL